MAAVIVAMGILMWVWATACRVAVGAWLPAAAVAARRGWLALGLALGAGLLAALAQWTLPASLLSQGWSRETLEAAQRGCWLVVGLAAAGGFLRGQHLLIPATPSPLRPASVTARGKAASPAKRRP